MSMRWPLLLMMLASATGCSRLAQAQFRAAQDARVKDTLASYEQARSRRDLVGQCVSAGVVAISYQGAGDQANASAWNARRREDCAAARAAADPGASASKSASERGLR